MKKKKIILYLSYSIFILFYTNCSNLNNNYPNINTHKSFNPDSLLRSGNSVELIIESEFDNYLLGQNVWIKVDVINNTNLNFYSTDPKGIDFKIIEPGGEIVKKKFIRNTSVVDELFVLKPGERYQDIVSLETYMDWYDYKIGTYKISCGLYGDGYHNIPDLESNGIEIEVMKPKGNDKKLFALTGRLGMYPMTTEKILYLNNLINQYDKSVYIPQLYGRLIVLSESSNKDIIELNINRYFKKYVNFFETKQILTAYVNHLQKNKNLTNNELDQVILDLANRNQTEKSKIVFDSFFKTTYKEIKERNYEDN